ncbi:MAG: hypothetical protein GXN97_01240 [Aquificae bacterium]|nr:hypothetical protein [Aquificota bacterium]
MQKTAMDVLDEIRQEVKEVLKKHNLKWTKLNVWETSDGFIAIIETPDLKDDIKAISISRKLEKELNDPTVTLSILPTE